MNNVDTLVEDFGIQYILEALDIEPAFVVQFLVERKVIDEDELKELLGIDNEEEEDVLF